LGNKISKLRHSWESDIMKLSEAKLETSSKKIDSMITQLRMMVKNERSMQQMSTQILVKKAAKMLELAVDEIKSYE